MYEETCNVPLIVRVPGGPAGVASQALVSHLDILPTMVHLTGNEPPACLHGTSLAPLLRNPGAAVRAHALLSFTRFAINHDDWGEFYPVRCIVDERYKLAINLFETDELYDLVDDPHELNNLIDDPAHHYVRAPLHDSLLAEMDRIRDPFRSFRWGDRPWRTVRKQFYSGGERRNRLPCFPFQPKGLEADGRMSG